MTQIYVVLIAYLLFCLFKFQSKMPADLKTSRVTSVSKSVKLLHFRNIMVRGEQRFNLF
jgi:hypothetical protein